MELWDMPVSKPMLIMLSTLAWLVTLVMTKKQTEGRTDQCQYLTALRGEARRGR